MILCINSGNTMTNFALMGEGRLVHEFKCFNSPVRTADEYAAWLMPLLNHLGYPLSQVIGCVLASVVPEAQANLIQFAKYYIKGPFHVLSKDHPRLGLKTLVDASVGVGADMLASTIGAYTHYGKKPCIVVDCGTATTSTCIDPAGNFVGTLIAPGFKTAMVALCNNGALLPTMTFDRPQAIIGKNSMDAINAGMYFGYSGLVEGLIKAAKEFMLAEYALPAHEVPVIGTGGYIACVKAQGIDHQDDQLVFKGLWEFYQRAS